LTASGFNVVLDAVRTVFVAKILGPSLTGLYTTLLVIPQIAQYLNCGWIEAMTVLIPHSRGKKDNDAVEKTKNNILIATFVVSLSTFVCVALYALFLSKRGLETRVLMIFSGSLIFLWEIKQFFTTNYATEGKFLKLSRIELLFSSLVAFLQVTLILLFKEVGFWFGLMIPNMIVIFLTANDYFKDHRFHWPSPDIYREIKRITPLGLGLLSSSVTYAPFTIIARIFLASVVGVREVGIFLLSFIVISKLSIIPSTIGKVVTPYLSRLHGEDAKPGEIFSLFIKSQLFNFSLCLLIIGMGFAFLRPLVSLILPQYLEGVPAAKMMLVACIPYSLIENANNTLLALHRKKIYFFNLILALGVQLIILGYFYKSHSVSALTVAVSLIIAFFINALLSNYQVFKLRRSS